MVAEPVQQERPLHCIRGFEHINRYWDRLHGVYAAKILPGQFYVTLQAEAIVTVLGSCVAACIRDRVFGVGGMNHFMLPEENVTGERACQAGSESTRYGNHAMEKLINEILKNGGRRENLEVKIFGGGQIIRNMRTMDIGQRNISFVRNYVRIEGLELLADDTGDIYPRKVMYFPDTGRVRVKRLRTLHNDTIVRRELSYREEIGQQPIAGDIELFG